MEEGSQTRWGGRLGNPQLSALPGPENLTASVTRKSQAIALRDKNLFGEALRAKRRGCGGRPGLLLEGEERLFPGDGESLETPAAQMPGANQWGVLGSAVVE